MIVLSTPAHSPLSTPAKTMTNSRSHHNLLLWLALLSVSLSCVFGAKHPQIYREDNGDLHINPGDNQTVYIGDVDILAENAQLKVEIAALKSAGSGTATDAFFGDVTVSASSESMKNRMRSVRVIMGTLSLAGAWTAELCKATFPNLERVEGSFELDQRKYVTDVEFPSLVTIQGRLHLSSNDGLTNISFPNLESIATEFFVGSHSTLVGMKFPKLKMIGNLFITGNGLVDKVNFPELSTVGTVKISSNKFLTSIHLPKISTAVSVQIFSNSELRHINFLSLNSTTTFRVPPDVDSLFPNITFIDTYSADVVMSVDYKSAQQWMRSVQNIDGKLTLSGSWTTELCAETFKNLRKIGGNFVVYESQVVSISMPMLTTIAGSLLITEHYARPITSARFPALTAVHKNFEIRNNGNLASIAFPKLRSIAGDHFWLYGNALSNVDISTFPSLICLNDNNVRSSPYCSDCSSTLISDLNALPDC